MGKYSKKENKTKNFLNLWEVENHLSLDKTSKPEGGEKKAKKVSFKSET